MSATGWRQSVEQYIRAEARPVDKFSHQPRLYALATQIGQGLDFDDDIVFAAAWMHDLGVFIGHRPEDPVQLAAWNHIPYTIERSRDLLASWGFPLAKLDGVEAAIRTHLPDSQPEQIEAVLLHDADILEQLGAVGAFRAISKIGRDTRYATFSSVIPVLKYAVEMLPDRLLLPAARRLASPRVHMLQVLIASYQEETGSLLNYKH